MTTAGARHCADVAGVFSGDFCAAPAPKTAETRSTENERGNGHHQTLAPAEPYGTDQSATAPLAHFTTGRWHTIPVPAVRMGDVMRVSRRD